MTATRIETGIVPVLELGALIIGQLFIGKDDKGNDGIVYLAGGGLGGNVNVWSPRYGRGNSFDKHTLVIPITPDDLVPGTWKVKVFGPKLVGLNEIEKGNYFRVAAGHDCDGFLKGDVIKAGSWHGNDIDCWNYTEDYSLIMPSETAKRWVRLKRPDDDKKVELFIEL